MDRKTYPNGLAFPTSYEEEYGDYGQKNLVTHDGLTKREYFAAKALQGLAGCTDSLINEGAARTMAKEAVLLADALISELNKPITK